MEGQEEKTGTLEISDAEWETAMGGEEPVTETPAEEMAAETPVTETPASEPPAGITPELWGSLTPEAQQAFAGTLEKYETDHRKEMDKVAQKIDEYKTGHAATMQAVNTMAEIIKAGNAKPEVKDDLPPLPDEDELDGDPRAMRKYYELKLARERADIEKNFEAKLAAVAKEAEDKISGKLKLADTERDQADAIRQANVFAEKHPDWEKYRDDMSIHLLRVERDGKTQEKTRLEHMEDAIAFAKEQEEFKVRKQAQERNKKLPTPASKANGTAVSPPPKKSTTISEAMENALETLKREGKNLDGIFSR
jgi:hypothetical protein